MVSEILTLICHYPLIFKSNQIEEMKSIDCKMNPQCLYVCLCVLTFVCLCVKNKIQLYNDRCMLACVCVWGEGGGRDMFEYGRDGKACMRGGGWMCTVKKNLFIGNFYVFFPFRIYLKTLVLPLTH